MIWQISGSRRIPWALVAFADDVQRPIVRRLSSQSTAVRSVVASSMMLRCSQTKEEPVDASYVDDKGESTRHGHYNPFLIRKYLC